MMETPVDRPRPYFNESLYWTEQGFQWFEAEVDALSNIKATVRNRFLEADTTIIDRAWKIVSTIRQNQDNRYSGRCALQHALAVARMIAELGLEPESIAAAILHDVIEDTPFTISELTGSFGKRITHLVITLSMCDDKNLLKMGTGFQQNKLKNLCVALCKDIGILPAVFIKLAEKWIV